MKPGITPEEFEKLSSGRLLREAAHAMIPLYAKMREDIIARIIQCHKDPSLKENLPGYAAELSVLSDLTGMLKRNDTATTRMEEKYNAGQ